jgi:hypothetical protein
MPSNPSVTDYVPAGSGKRLARLWRWCLAGSMLAHLISVGFIMRFDLQLLAKTPTTERVTELAKPVCPEDRSSLPDDDPCSTHMSEPPPPPPTPPPPKLIVPMDQVEATQASLEVIDDQRQLGAVLARFGGSIAFGPNEESGYFTSRFRAPDWNAVTVSGGLESTELYFSLNLPMPNYSLPTSLRAQKKIGKASLAYALFPWSQEQLFKDEIKRAASQQGIRRVHNAVVRYSSRSDSGFEVVTLIALPAQTANANNGGSSP